MYIIEVAPLLKSSTVSSLSYYSVTDYSLGTLLSIPVRKKEVKGVVLGSKPLSAAKAAVRAATFSLKRLPPQEAPQLLSPLVVETAQELTKKAPPTFGAVLFTLLPPEIRSGEIDVAQLSPKEISQDNFMVSVLTATKEERFLSYKRRIREAFARKGSVLFVSPTNESLMQAADELLIGIEERSIVISNELPKRALKKAYQSSTDMSVAKIILTTPSRAFIDRSDITDVIIDNSSSGHYRSRIRPYLDLKEALITHSQISGRRVLLGDLVHRSEDESLRRREIYQTEEEEPHRINLSGQLRIIEQKDKPSSDSPFQLLSPELLDVLKLTLKEKKNAFLYAARRGLSPVVVCGDCGYIFRCPDSGSPYSLLRTTKDGEEKRWFLSPTSGRRVRAADTCPGCGSWRLRERGIGIQYIHDELKKYFPEEKIFVFDHTTATTSAKAHTIIGDFYAKKGAILLGTAMAVPFIEKPVTHSVIVSLDAVRSIPTWRVDEVTFALLMRLREISNESVFLQTRTEKDELLDMAASGSVDKFFTEELRLRQEMHYPPYYKLVHLTLSGNLAAVQKLEGEISSVLKPFGFSFYSSPESLPNKTTRYGLARFLTSEWPREDVLEVLKILPPSVKIQIDPDRIV